MTFQWIANLLRSWLPGILFLVLSSQLRSRGRGVAVPVSRESWGRVVFVFRPLQVYMWTESVSGALIFSSQSQNTIWRDSGRRHSSKSRSKGGPVLSRFLMVGRSCRRLYAISRTSMTTWFRELQDVQSLGVVQDHRWRRCGLCCRMFTSLMLRNPRPTPMQPPPPLLLSSPTLSGVRSRRRIRSKQSKSGLAMVLGVVRSCGARRNGRGIITSTTVRLVMILTIWCLAQGDASIWTSKCGSPHLAFASACLVALRRLVAALSLDFEWELCSVYCVCIYIYIYICVCA